jgi:carbamoyl-phosphate synthase small subunit
LTFTYPLVGNYGVPKPLKQDTHLLQNFESEKIWVAGVVLSSLPEMPSHYQSIETFSDWLKSEKIPGIARIDTRALTIKLREHGVLAGVISPKKNQPKSFLMKYNYTQVSCSEVITYKSKHANEKQIALIDCGVKHGIIRTLLKNGYTVTRVPWNVNPLDLKQNFSAIIGSNGPGDPKDWGMTVETIRKILSKKIPFLGICLGHQLLALAIGADTYKLKYGHRGLNQPVQDVITQKCYITSQNHGYAVKTKTIPKGFEQWFINLNDQTNEGLKHSSLKIASCQFHPEGQPGPNDSEGIFNNL